MVLLGAGALLKSLRDMMDVERYASIASPVHSWDPRIKLVTTILLIVTAVSVNSIVSMLFLFSIILVLGVLSRLPMRSYLGRATLFIPFFAGVIALPLLFTTPGAQVLSFQLQAYQVVITREGVAAAFHFVFRVWLCVASLILLLLTTNFTRIIRGLEKLRVPQAFTVMLSITYRYIFLCIDELMRMLRAREARTFGKLGTIRSAKLIAGVVSTSIGRSYERGERVYQAMLARGFDGRFRTFNDLKLRLPGVIGGFLMIMALATIALVDSGVVFPDLVPTLRVYIRTLTGW
jgi:cobalt/nickel transport system permease protein